MKKSILVMLMIAAVSLLLFAACTKSQPSGYAAYQGQQQGQGAIGGGCGVTAPADSTEAAEQVINAEALSA